MTEAVDFGECNIDESICLQEPVRTIMFDRFTTDEVGTRMAEEIETNSRST